MNEQTHISRLRALLEARPKRRHAAERRLIAATRACRRKETFWLLSVGLLFAAGVLFFAAAYLLASRAGLLSPPPVEALQDPRWGVRYNATRAPVSSMAVHDGRVYIGTDGNGLHAFDVVTRLWTTYHRDQAERGVPENAISLVKIDATDPTGIWAVTRHGGLSVARAGMGWRTLFGATPFPGLSDWPFVTAARSGPFLAVGTGNEGVGLFDLRRNDWIAHLTPRTHDRMPSDQVYAVRAGMGEGVFWAGVSQGLARIEDAQISGLWLNGPDAGDVIDIEVEPEATWYLTSNPVAVGYIDREDAHHPMIRANAPPMAADQITSAAQAGETLWVGTRQHGVVRYNMPAHRWETMPIARSDTSALTAVTALTYNAETDELFVAGDDGLRILPRTQALEDKPSNTQAYTAFRHVRKMQNIGPYTYMLTDAGKLGVRRPEQKKQAQREWWQFLRKRNEEDSEITTLVDVAGAGFNAEDISAACQSEDRLYFGTVNGEIAWYNKKTHAWTPLSMPLSHGIDQMVHNPYTGTTVALSGYALYRSPPGSDLFILLLSVPYENVEIIPTDTGYLIWADDRILVHFDDNTNRITPMLDSKPAEEPDFQPVAVEQVGGALYFVAKTGRVMMYDTLRRRWDVPDDIFDAEVTHLRGVGPRVVYQTRDRRLFGSGGNTLIGGGSLDVPDERIRHAVEHQQMLWVASDRVIGKYNMFTHTWMERDRIVVPGPAPVSHLLPMGRRLIYRTGDPWGEDGTLWSGLQALDENVGDVAGIRNTLWYVKHGEVYRWRADMEKSAGVLGGGRIPRNAGERMVSAADFDDRIWIATNARLMSYHKNLRIWQHASLPDGNPPDDLYQAGRSLYAVTDGAVYRRIDIEEKWTRISPTGSRVLDAAFSPTGATFVLDDAGLYHAPDPYAAPQHAFALKPNAAPVPVAYNAIHAARQNGTSLHVAVADHLLRYDTAAHVWDAPLRLSASPIRHAVIEDNRIWAQDENGRIVTTVLTDARRAKIEERRPPQSILDRLSTPRDEVWVDTPFWRWERQQGRPRVVLKTQNAGEQPLDRFTGPALERFPFDRTAAVTHAGETIWAATDAGLIRFPEKQLGRVDALQIFVTDTAPVDLVTTSLPDGVPQVVYRAAGAPGRLYRFDGRAFEPLTLQAGDPDPFEDRVLIDDPLWRWTRRRGAVTAAFVQTDIRDRSVFDDTAPFWRFRFDHTRAIAARNGVLYMVADGLISGYSLSNETLSLKNMRLAPGPPVTPGEQARVRIRNPDVLYIKAGRSPDRARIFQSRRAGVSRRLEAVDDAGEVFRRDVLVNNGFWRWERDNTTGRVQKYLLRPDGAAHEFRMSDGRFVFDDIRGFTVDDAHLWVATSGGIARYPVSAIRLPLNGLEYEREIAGHQNPDVTRIHVRNDTVYCALKGLGMYARPVSGGVWSALPEGANPWVRKVVDTPFWTWTHDMQRQTATGVYRDHLGVEKPVTWPDGTFDFDRVFHVAWDSTVFWLDTRAGLSAYPDHGPLLSLDSLRINPEFSHVSRLFTVPNNMPAASGAYLAQNGRLYRFDKDTAQWTGIDESSLPKTGGYAPWAYLQDRIRYDILADYDGFWHCRRARPGNPRQASSVVLEALIEGVWRPVALENGRFAFDDVRDFAFEGASYLWLATMAGICRYDLSRSWLDLRSMKPFWGPQYADATDVARFVSQDENRLVVRRGYNNDTVIEIDPGHPAPARMPAYASPFTVVPQVQTPYWRWSLREQYRGSVAIEDRMTVELRDATGVWIPVELPEADAPLPFDQITSIAVYEGALWVSTPAGVWRYPPGQDMSLARATFYQAGGNLMAAQRISVARLGGGRTLVCETGSGQSRRLFFLDARGGWQEAAGQQPLEQLLFKEDAWDWYEQDGQVRIRYRDDPARTRPVSGTYFADHYIRAAAPDGASVWCLTPAGLFRYELQDGDIPVRLLKWLTWDDFQNVPAALTENLKASFSMSITSQHKIWLLGPKGLFLFRLDAASDRIEYISYTPFDTVAGKITGGHLWQDKTGALIVSLMFETRDRVDHALFAVEPRSPDPALTPLLSIMNARLREALRQARHTWPGLFPDAVIAMDEDDAHIWLATPAAVYRVYKEAAGISKK